MAQITDMTVDELARVITPQFLEESAQQISRELQQIPFQVFQDQTAKYVTVLPGVRNSITFNELEGDAELGPWKSSRRDDADYAINGRTLEVFPGNCAKDFDPMPLLHSIWGESIAAGERISKGMIARKLVTLFAAKIGMHIDEVVFVGGVRNKAGDKTADLFDSFDTIIGREINAGNIASAKGNYLHLGAIDETNAVEKLKEFWRAADKMLRKQGRHAYMYMSQDIYDYYCDDYQARHGALPYNTSYDKVTLEGSKGRCELAVLDNMACTFCYAGIYGEQIRSLRKENLMIGDLGENDTYYPVVDTTGKNPKAEGWYELSGSSYVATNDTAPASGKTYYIKN